MTPPSLIDSQGRAFPLDLRLASGGEGAVYAIPNDPGRVAKVYHKLASPQTGEKLAAMIGLANPQLLSLAAWPTALLRDARTRAVAGFVMPRIDDCQPVQHLYNPIQRQRFFPRAGWSFQLRAASNLAAAFDEVHKAGCLVGDVNQSNAFVSAQALVRLVDCDSFQVRAGGKQYLCEVGVPHYTPPELQKKSFRGLVRTENHDRFGLAVLIYQLLFVGRHPYMGIYHGAGEPSFEDDIMAYRFAQGPAAHTWSTSPAPHTPTFADIPSWLGDLFRRSFERGSENGNRPRPAEWLTSLKRLEQETADCPADPGHKFWRGAKGCVWCRLADRGGPEYYFGVAGGGDGFAIDEGRLQDVMRRLTAAQAVEFGYDRNRFAPTRTPEPDPLPDDIDEHQNFATAVEGAALFCAFLIVLGAYRRFLAVIGFLGALVFGVWYFVLYSRSPRRREQRRRQTARRIAVAHLRELEGTWEGIVRKYQADHARTDAAVRKLVTDCRELAAGWAERIRQLTASAEATARLRHMRLHLLADADIPKIGAGRKQVLAAAGIFTAADVREDRVRDIKGFGAALTQNLVAWRDEVNRRFQFDPATGVSPTNQRALAVQFRTRQQQLLAESAQQLGVLESLAPACRTALQKLTADLRSAVTEVLRADAGLKLLQRG